MDVGGAPRGEKILHHFLKNIRREARLPQQANAEYIHNPSFPLLS